MGFFAFLPILGSAITIVLGLARANIVLSVLEVLQWVKCFVMQF